MMTFFNSIYKAVGWLIFSTILTTKKQIEFCRVAFCYWLPIGFWKVDFFYLRRFLVIPAHIASQRFLKTSGLDRSYTYGATPLTSLEQILSRCNLKKGQRVADLGCGPGRTCFFIRKRFQVEVVGVDIVPFFIQTAKEIKLKLSLDGVDFQCGDILNLDCSGLDCIYLFGTTWRVDMMKDLISKLESELMPGALVVSIKQPLDRYFAKTRFVVEQQFCVSFFWGKDSVFIQRLA